MIVTNIPVVVVVVGFFVCSRKRSAKQRIKHQYVS